MNDHSSEATTMLNTYQHGDIVRGELQLKTFKMTVSFYVIDGLLIDTGAPLYRQLLQSFVDEQGVEQAVLTHHHEDHSGLAGWLEEERHIPVYMLAETQRILKDPPKIPLYRRLLWGQMPKANGSVIGSHLETDRYCFDVIHTPGHCQDHLALVEPTQGIVFTGDLFVAKSVKYSFPFESIRETIRSIDSLLEYDFNDLYCAHAGHIKNGRAALQNKKMFLQSLVDKVLTLHDEGYSFEHIHKSIYPTTDWKHIFTGGEFSSHNLVQNILREYSKELNTRV